MGAFQIQELNHKHIAIAEYLLMHPSALMREVAEAVGLSASWVSTVVNSELFRDYLMERHKEIGGTVATSLREKVHGVAHASVEKLGRMLDESTDPDFVLAVADRAMHRLGMGASGTGATGAAVQIFNAPVQQNSVDPRILEDARNKIHQLAGVVNVSSLSSSEGIQGGGVPGEREVPPLPALVHSAEET